MHQATFAAATRRAAAIDRKTSLQVLAGAAAALAAARPGVAAGKAQGKCAKRCRRQEDPCKAYWQVECGPNLECWEHMRECCALLADCKGHAYFECTSPNVVVE